MRQRKRGKSVSYFLSFSLNRLVTFPFQIRTWIYWRWIHLFGHHLRCLCRSQLVCTASSGLYRASIHPYCRWCLLCSLHSPIDLSQQYNALWSFGIDWSWRGHDLGGAGQLFDAEFGSGNDGAQFGNILGNAANVFDHWQYLFLLSIARYRTN